MLATDVLPLGLVTRVLGLGLESVGRGLDAIMLYTFVLVFGDGSCAPSILVERILAVPASLAPVERVYSNSGLILHPHRVEMSDKLLKSLVFAKCTIFS